MDKHAESRPPSPGRAPEPQMQPAHQPAGSGSRGDSQFCHQPGPVTPERSIYFIPHMWRFQRLNLTPHLPHAAELRPSPGTAITSDARMLLGKSRILSFRTFLRSKKYLRTEKLQYPPPPTFAHQSDPRSRGLASALPPSPCIFLKCCRTATEAQTERRPSRKILLLSAPF